MQNCFEIATKSAQDSRKIYILKLKMQQLLGSQVGPRPLVYRVMYLQAKPILINKFVKMPRIFYIKIDIL